MPGALVEEANTPLYFRTLSYKQRQQQQKKYENKIKTTAKTFRKLKKINIKKGKNIK